MRPTAVGHAELSIFHIAATHPASYNLEEFRQHLGQAVMSDLTPALQHEVTLTEQGVGDARGNTQR